MQCTKYKVINKGFLQGFADVYVPEWKVTINGCKLFQKKNQRWVNLPDKEYTKQDGTIGYAPIIRFESQEDQREFTNRAKEAIEKHIATNPQVDSFTPDQNVPF